MLRLINSQQGNITLDGIDVRGISLARALLKKPAILILDKAPAMFDPEEALFSSTNSDLLRNHAVIITHRPASLQLADQVLRLENGQLIESA